MGCCGTDRNPEVVIAEHKFAYVNLADFKSTSWWNTLAYAGIYSGTIISLACYAADIYTATILLTQGRWTNKLEQQRIIDFEIARIIFCACILLSFILLGIDWYLAIRVIKSDGVAEAYLNVIAVRYNCIRGGKGRGDTGWKRFLVFSKLTSSRGFNDYIALFTYFAFKGWLRILIAEGPRVVINALTFISVFKLEDLVKDSHGDANGVFEQFWENVQAMYRDDPTQVLSLGTMAFTTLMWVFAILRLLLSSLLFVCILWHRIGGRGLRKYCKERIDTRLGAIIQKKNNKALAVEKTKLPKDLLRQPTLPQLQSGDTSWGNDDAMGSTAKLIPSPPASTVYSSPVVPQDMMREPTLPNLGPEKPKAVVVAPQGLQRMGSVGKGRMQDPYEGPGEYQMQALPPREGGQMGGADWGAGPRSKTADPYVGYQDRQREQPPRSQTAGPGYGQQNRAMGPGAGPSRMDRGFGPGRGGYGPPPRGGAGGFAPQGRSLTAQPGQAYGPPPRGDGLGPPMGGGNAYGPPPRGNGNFGGPRSQTAQPGPGGYGPPPRGGRGGDAYSQPPRSRTAGPQNGAYNVSPEPPYDRSQTAAPGDAYSISQQQSDPYAQQQQQQPPRSQTAAPQAYDLPRSHTAAPQTDSFNVSPEPPYTRSATAAPSNNAYPAPLQQPPRSHTAAPPTSDPYSRSATTAPDNAYPTPSQQSPPRSQTTPPQDPVGPTEDYPAQQQQPSHPRASSNVLGDSTYTRPQIPPIGPPRAASAAPQNMYGGAAAAAGQPPRSQTAAPQGGRGYTRGKYTPAREVQRDAHPTMQNDSQEQWPEGGGGGV